MDKSSDEELLEQLRTGLAALRKGLDACQAILDAYQPKNSKTSVLYWKRRLRRPAYTKNGQRGVSPHFALCISAKGERHNISLRVGDLDEAAQMACDFYLRVVRDGWGDALLHTHPAMLLKRQPKR
jgi:hypothetical protein